MTDEQWVPLTYDEAAARLTDGDEVHCFMNPAGMLLGADWSRDTVLACLRASADAGELAEAGPTAKQMKHGVRAVHEDAIVWFETKDAEP